LQRLTKYTTAAMSVTLPHILIFIKKKEMAVLQLGRYSFSSANFKFLMSRSLVYCFSIVVIRVSFKNTLLIIIIPPISIYLCYYDSANN